MKHKWIRVTKKHPCPICGKPDWCTYTEDGRMVLCMRVANGHPSRGQAGGWIYKNEAAACSVVNSSIYADEDPHMPKKSVDYILAEWKKNTIGITLSQFAADLGVSRASLERLGCVWCAGRSCWAFPMRDENGVPIGIRLRSKTSKTSVKGSRTGLFFDPGTKPGASRCAWLTEGPTDTAAMLSIGARVVVGRSDLLSAWGMLKKALARLEIRTVNICVDDEGWIEGRKDSPGRNGSLRLARTLGLPCKFVRVSGCKDIREFVKTGGTMKELGAMMSYQKYIEKLP